MKKTILLLCVLLGFGAQSIHEASGLIPERKEEVLPVLEEPGLKNSKEPKGEKELTSIPPKSKPTKKPPKENPYTNVGRFTAYTCRPGETQQKHPFRTADGTDLRKVNFCVVANNELPFGTMVDIDGLGRCIVKDRMGKGGKQKFDVYMTCLRRAKEFGIKKLKYQVVRK
jgi:3D (Asp-Asp-Asp) domain-containing protein